MQLVKPRRIRQIFPVTVRQLSMTTVICLIVFVAVILFVRTYHFQTCVCHSVYSLLWLNWTFSHGRIV